MSLGTAQGMSRCTGGRVIGGGGGVCGVCVCVCVCVQCIWITCTCAVCVAVGVWAPGCLCCVCQHTLCVLGVLCTLCVVCTGTLQWGVRCALAQGGDVCGVAQWDGVQLLSAPCDSLVVLAGFCLRVLSRGVARRLGGWAAGRLHKCEPHRNRHIFLADCTGALIHCALGVLYVYIYMYEYM